ncbi:hypothetical protein BJV74DRAFT_852283 [Russula compacta]|nr:hypothetical protein BJV74DRAFT_852283 [Russula compacta]
MHHLHTDNLRAKTVEMLQVLKYSYRRERLDFMAGMLAKEEDYTIEGPVTQSAILELLKSGKEIELEELYMNWGTDSNI